MSGPQQSNLAIQSHDFEFGGRDNPATHPDYRNNPLIQLGLLPLKPDIHVSDIDTYRSCRRKHLLGTVFGLRIKGGRKPGALERGTYFHEISRELYTSGDLERAYQYVDVLHSRDVEAINQSQDVIGILPGGRTANSAKQELLVELEKAKVMAGWAWRYAKWPEPPETLNDWDVLGVEQTVRAYWPSLKDWTRHTFDLVVRNKETHEIYILDHKTTTKSPSKEAARFRFALQPRLYTVVGAKAYGDNGVFRGFIHNVLRSIGIKLKQKQEWDDYLLEAQEWYQGSGRHADKLADRRGDPSFVRSHMVFPTTPDEELMYVLHEYRQALRARPHIAKFDRNDGSCFDWNSVCPFHENICSVDPVLWPNKIMTMFEQQPHREARDTNVLTIEME